MRPLALPPRGIALDGVGRPTRAEAGGHDEGERRVHARLGGDGAPDLRDHLLRHEPNFLVGEAQVIDQVRLHALASDLHAFGMRDDPPKDLGAELEG